MSVCVGCLADLVESAALFRRAAGVYQYLAEHVLPDLQSVPSADRPPEATVSMASAMSLISLAEAQVPYTGCPSLSSFLPCVWTPKLVEAYTNCPIPHFRL